MTEDEKIRQYIQNWKLVGDELDRVKAQELRSLSEQESAERIHDVLLMADSWAKIHGASDRECGMVEQQRIFERWPKRPN
jgi:hypothetical protein